MNQNYKISVIIPAYNVQNYIEECINSVLNQTYKNIEVIVVNDGSTDDTLKVIKNIATKDNRVIVIDQKNSGVAFARNAALDIVDSNYIMFLDSDDWLDLNTCECILNEAKKENADIVLFGYVREYENKSMPKAIFDDDKIVFEREDVLNKLHRRVFGPINEELHTPEKLNIVTSTCMAIYKRDVIKNLKFKSIEELGICEDGYFNIGAFKNAQKVVFLKKFFYHYRKVIDGGSITQNNDDNTYQKAKKFYYELNKIITQEKLPNDYKVATDNRFAMCLIERVNNRNIVYKNIKNILNDSEYKVAIKNLDLKYMPIHWKVFFGFAKIRFTFGVFVLLKVINQILSTR